MVMLPSNTILKGTSSIRSISFFAPAARLNEFNKRQLQNNASIEVFEKNYTQLENYFIKFNESNHPIHANDKILTKDFQFNGNNNNNNNNNHNTLVMSLDSIDFDFLQNNKDDLILENSNYSKRQDFIEKTKFLLFNSDIRNLYNHLKSNIIKLNEFQTMLSSYEISLIIKRLIYYNNSISSRLKFVTKNKNNLFENDNNIEKYIKKLNAISRNTYLSTKSIFNSLLKSNLSVYDYENIILLHYERNFIKKTIDLISDYENKTKDKSNYLYMSNLIWYIKMDILSKTNKNFWTIYGETLYKINSNLKLSSNYLYPHHNHNFQDLINRYEKEKSLNELNDNLNILNVIIKGLGQNGDLESLDKFIESNWGIKIDRTGDKGIYLLEHFKLNKKVNELIWPDENLLINILLSYSKNGELATGIEINNLILDNYNKLNLFDIFNTSKYWTIALKCTGLFGDAVDKKISIELNNNNNSNNNNNNNSLLEIKYRLFDKVWEMSEKYVNKITRDMVKLKIKYSSSHELLNRLDKIYSNIGDINYNRTHMNIITNEMTINQYVRECCIELANRGRFLDANIIIDKFVKSKQSVEGLKTMLAEMQEVYARKRVKSDELKRRIDDDDDDFGLW